MGSKGLARPGLVFLKKKKVGGGLQTFARKCVRPAFSGGVFPPFSKAHVRFCSPLLGSPGLVRSGEMHWSLRYCKVLFLRVKR